MLAFVAAGVLATRVVPSRQGIGVKAGADVPGAAQLIVGLMLGVYTILQVSSHGWTATRTLLLGAIAVALLTTFLVRQARIANPLMPLRLFRSRTVSGANVIEALLAASMFGVSFIGALYLQ